MKKPLLISGAVLLGLIAVFGWSFELQRTEETVGAYNLIFKGALVGCAFGALLGFYLATKEHSFIARFQSFASSLLIFSLLASLFAHYSNRSFVTEEPVTAFMTVKQVTATWKDLGLTRQELSSPPDGYYIFVETDKGTIRLFSEGAIAPDIGPSRSISVEKQIGFWGYPRYSISIEDE